MNPVQDLKDALDEYENCSILSLSKKQELADGVLQAALGVVENLDKRLRVLEAL